MESMLTEGSLGLMVKVYNWIGRLNHAKLSKVSLNLPITKLPIMTKVWSYTMYTQMMKTSLAFNLITHQQ